MRRSGWPGIAPPGTRPGLGVRLLVALLLGLAPSGAAAPARAADPMGFVRADQWSEAAAAAAGAADPVAVKLVTFYRLLAPQSATPDQISAFMAANPDWPDRALLARRRQQAIVADNDPADVAAQCAQGSITLAETLAHCADALDATGHPEAAADAARRAWAAGLTDPALVPAFLHRWSADLTPTDEWSRFGVLLHTDPAAASAQIRRLPPARQPAARARLALRRNLPNGLALARALPAAERTRPDLVLAEARWLRHADRDADALDLWRRHGFAAERAVPPEQRAAFWTERDILARSLLRDGDAAGAFDVADDTAQTAPSAVANSGFLAGFIALTRLHDPVQAARCFHRLTAVSHAAITVARAQVPGWAGPQPPPGRTRTTRIAPPPPGPPPSTASLPPARWDRTLPQ